MPPEFEVKLGMPVWSGAAIAALVVVAAIIDVRTDRVPNWLTYPAVLLGLAGHALLGGWSGLDGQPGLPWALAGLGAGFGPMLVCWMAGGIGGGDAKLMGAIGALGGWRFVIAAMMYGFIIAAIMAVFVTVRKGVFRRTLRRIATAVALTFTPGVRPADPTSKDSPRIPFAVALCVGAVVAGIASFFKARLV